ncbi:hypothetical protein DFQ28_000184 [Apophysomyces sp. BC1034]|nr:hypothetical protein DFQ30_000373 [Apophysomyces sp. BC1015]KAG0178975.1 hypothetical protein DFQ29_002770 [Apophysomyces sp. BC1021]KAG0184075.1 hypothetical protein DFQ28_000184 [Apophysomyces sp. BC1034]
MTTSTAPTTASEMFVSPQPQQDVPWEPYDSFNDPSFFSHSPVPIANSPGDDLSEDDVDDLDGQITQPYSIPAKKDYSRKANPTTDQFQVKCEPAIYHH